MKYFKFPFVKIIFSVSILFATTLFALNVLKVANHPRVEKFDLKKVYTGDPGFQKQWNSVDSLEKLEQTKSALTQVENIYQAAKMLNIQPQILKSLIYKVKYKQTLEEGDLEKAIAEFENEITASKFPLTPVLQSCAAEMYWQYYTQNRWSFYYRTQTVQFKNDDLTTWDLQTIMNKITTLYDASVSKEDSLKKVSIKIFDDVLIKGFMSEVYRPTLYDFLANRAVTFYTNQETSITKPLEKFTLDLKNGLAPAPFFAQAKFISTDSTSNELKAIQLFQKLILFHFETANKDALVDIDLRRLFFARQNILDESADSIYKVQLHMLLAQFAFDSCSAQVLLKTAYAYANSASEYNSLISEKHKWDNTIAIDQCETLVKKFPKSTWANAAKNFESQLIKPTVILQSEKVNCAAKPFRLFVKFKNTLGLNFRIIRSTQKIEEDLNESGDSKSKSDYISGLKYVEQFYQKMPEDGDYQEHSTEVKMPSLPSGKYLIVACNDENFSAASRFVVYGFTQVSDLAYFRQQSYYSSDAQLFVVDRNTGAPKKNVTVYQYERSYNYKKQKYERNHIGTYVTDENGMVNPKSTSYRDYYLDFYAGKDTLCSDDYFYNYGSNDYKQKPYTFTKIFTDRSIYRPGQTIYFKAIVIDCNGKENYKIKTDFTTTVQLMDANYQKRSEVKLTTNEFGTCSGTFTAPDDGMNGNMTLKTDYGSLSISVEEYKRPHFNVTFDTLRGDYGLNDNVVVKGFAKDFSGSVVSGGNVAFRVMRQRFVFNYWDWGNSYFQPTQISTGNISTGDDGSFTIAFFAKPDETAKKDSSTYYSYTVYADVTDITGETHSASTYTSIGSVGVKGDVYFPEKINVDSVKDYQINTSNLNGVFTPANCSVKIYDLREPTQMFRARLWNQPDRYTMTKDEFETNFPNDLYADEDKKEKWEKLSCVVNKTFDTKTEYSFSGSLLKNLPAGVYCAEIVAFDKNGNHFTNKKYFTIYSSSSVTAPENNLLWNENLIYYSKIGEIIHWHVAPSAADQQVLISYRWQNTFVKREWKKLKAGINTIDIPVTSLFDRNFSVSVCLYGVNSFYSYSQNISVPNHQHELKIKTQTFRNKIEPGKSETWSFIVTGADSAAVSAELMAGMYDASLDEFSLNYWSMNLFSDYYYYNEWTAGNNNPTNSIFMWNQAENYQPENTRFYDELNWFGFIYRYNNYNRYNDNVFYKSTGDYNYRGNVLMDDLEGGLVTAEDQSAVYSWNFDGVNDLKQKNDESPNGHASFGQTGSYALNTTPAAGSTTKSLGGKDYDYDKIGGEDLSKNIQMRKNLQETAFFFPQLHTNEKGEVIFSFTSPEALTKWKLMLFAHTKELQCGYDEETTVTQKELQMVPNAPRFLREGDDFYFTSKISNLSDGDLSGTATLQFFDALTNVQLDLFAAGQNGSVSFSAKKNLNDVASWHIKIPVGLQAVSYKVFASTDKFSDGEENILPVLTNRMLVTETMPLFVRGAQENNFTLQNLVNSNSSSTQTNFKLTLEMTTNPAWYAVQSLPYLMEYPYECAEQTFSRYYANSLATEIANSNPAIQKVFESWKTKDELISNLDKNQELKSLLLEETPWVRDAQNESERKQRLGILFDLSKMANQMKRAEKKLFDKQKYSGGWTWFDGMPEDNYLTEYIVSGFGHLKKLGVVMQKESLTDKMLSKGIYYLDGEMQKQFNWLIKDGADLQLDNLNSFVIEYMYARSFFNKDYPLSADNKTSYDYYFGELQKFWAGKSLTDKTMMALSLFRSGNTTTSQLILKALKENAIDDKEMGMYWKANRTGYGWYDGDIETQALIIEAFKEISADNFSIDEMKVWLLKQKQTQDWKTTTATANACYALLLTGGNWLAQEPDVKISLGNIVVQSSAIPDSMKEAGTGYFKKEWNGKEITADMGSIKISTNSTMPSWGGVYYQYFEDLDKIKTAATPLNLKKDLFVQRNDGQKNILVPLSDSVQLQVGDLLVVRIELRVDRNMDYVHMKDMHASGLEPLEVFSGYHWQDGLDYYQETKDASTNFFFDHIHKGTYVFEYKLRANLKGTFSNGITNIECMYAPEFTSHSQGSVVKIN